MQILSKVLSLPWLRPAKGKRRFQGAKRLSSSDAFAATTSGGGLRLSLLGKFLVIERKCIFAIVLGLALYAIGALLANEWLYLLAAGLLLGAVIGAVWPLLIVSSIDATAWLPEYSMAMEEAEISVRLKQSAFFGPFLHALPMTCLRVRVVLARRTIGGYELEDSSAEQTTCLNSCGQNASISIKIPRLARGVFKLSHVDVATCMPFGFCWAVRRVTLTDDGKHNNSLVVMPQATALRGLFLESLNGLNSPVGMRFANVRAFTQSTSVRGLREFRMGDSLRHIHWPSSAKSSKLLVREFDSETLPVFNIYLDLSAHWQSRSQFELAVQLAFSLVQFGFEHDMLPELLMYPGLDSESLEEVMYDLPQTLSSPLEMLGEILARVEPLPPSGAHKPAPESRYEVLALTPTKETMLVAGGQSSPIRVMRVDAGTPIADGVCIATIYSEKDMQAL